ncbi:DUF1405 domain-containing protein [Marinicrinis sediminis]|uniref:DUF1405 domain-containing protein n=1 Tax=Marinicrinis sediminis TaxID=1652465 RepID=A0ABW5RDV7_9BACL
MMKLSMITFFFSRSFLLNRTILWSVFWVNALGTIYGYEWYRNQLLDTVEHHHDWLVIFVPDSPTASLFFTLSIGLLLYRMKQTKTERTASSPVSSFIEAFAVVTSIKYGIWAVAMIIAGGMQGDTIVWKEYMLIVSHLGMAFEAALYARYMRYSLAAVLVVAVWTLLNDVMDYAEGIFPWLPAPLYDHLTEVAAFTVALSFLSVGCAWMLIRFREKRLV